MRPAVALHIWDWIGVDDTCARHRANERGLHADRQRQFRLVRRHGQKEPADLPRSAAGGHTDYVINDAALGLPDSLLVGPQFKSVRRHHSKSMLREAIERRRPCRFCRGFTETRPSWARSRNPNHTVRGYHAPGYPADARRTVPLAHPQGDRSAFYIDAALPPAQGAQ